MHTVFQSEKHTYVLPFSRRPSVKNCLMNSGRNGVLVEPSGSDQYKPIVVSSDLGGGGG